MSTKGKGAARGGDSLPAVVQVVSNLLQVAVAHVVDVEDEAVLELGDAFSDVLEELLLLLARLLGHLGKVEDL